MTWLDHERRTRAAPALTKVSRSAAEAIEILKANGWKPQTFIDYGEITAAQEKLPALRKGK
jgi:hypothetical protein